MSAQYEIEKHPHGWLVCSPRGQTGIPLSALSECCAMFPKSAVMAGGIPHHYNASGYDKHVVLAVATPSELKAWEKEIANSLKDLCPQSRWWRGTDVGKSSAALFHVFCDDNWKWCSNHMGERATPHDADDFGRCLRLLNVFPEWRTRLNEVAVLYADTPWPRIVNRWGELEAATPKRQSEILNECNYGVESI